MNFRSEVGGEAQHTAPRGSSPAPPIIHKVVLDSFMPANRGINSYLLQSHSSFSEYNIL